MLEGPICSSAMLSARLRCPIAPSARFVSRRHLPNSNAQRGGGGGGRSSDYRSKTRSSSIKRPVLTISSTTMVDGSPVLGIRFVASRPGPTLKLTINPTYGPSCAVAAPKAVTAVPVSANTRNQPLWTGGHGGRFLRTLEARVSRVCLSLTRMGEP